MRVYLNSIMGIPDAITTMFFSKRTWTRRLEEDIRNTCSDVLDRNGRMLDIIPMSPDKSYEKYCDWMSMLLKWGKSHTTMLEFIQLSFTVEGLHRGAQDDFDAHAERLDNRIIRSSTRMAKFMAGDVSEWYSDRIIPTEVALAMQGIKMPNKIERDGSQYTWTTHGYVRDDLLDDQDTVRGLYRLSIPSNFIFECDLANYCHIYQQRGAHGHAHPELKLCMEQQADEIARCQPLITREFMRSVKI